MTANATLLAGKVEGELLGNAALTDKFCVQTLPEQHLSTVKDINARIDGLESRIVQLTDGLHRS